MSSKPASQASLLENSNPVPDTDMDALKKSGYLHVLENLQGNILKGHGRDFSANIFLHFNNKKDIRNKIKALTETFVTSAFVQLEESNVYKRFKIPGSLFGNLFLTVKAYKKLGFTEKELETIFNDKDNVPPGREAAFALNSTFLKGMRAAAEDLGDIPSDLADADLSKVNVDTLSPIQKNFLFQKGKLTQPPKLDPLEDAYFSDDIDAMLLLADDDEDYLLRNVRTFISDIEKDSIKVLAVELGKALRNQDNEGIEHFGYVDGRSQPLYLASDFKNLKGGKIDPATTTEKINEKATRRESGSIDIWNPFQPLKRVLVEDKSAKVPNAFGSYFVFRKLEQDVLHFSMAEQQLADKLNLEGADRERAGAMAVGRFRDGTPLVLSETDGLIPAKANNFRFDGLAHDLNADPKSVNDRLGLKCPFHAHIRKTNPRQSVNDKNDNMEARKTSEERDRQRCITRRGIPYGDRVKHPNAFQTLDDLPTGNAGLLFACFQSSIAKQYAFMQKTWTNNVNFKVGADNSTGTGLDTIVGQSLSVDKGNPEQNWRKEFGGEILQDPKTLKELDLNTSHPTKFCFSQFVKFRGGEFFFAPSLPFLLNNGE